jgi:hypothetical protein
MRNKFPQACYRCGDIVRAGHGHFERHNGGWRTQHATCAIKYRDVTTLKWQVKDFADGWVNFKSKEDAASYAKSTGALMRPAVVV